MKRRSILFFAVGLALLVAACESKGGAETAGQRIKSATGYSLTHYETGDRRTPKTWSGPEISGGRIRSSEFNGSVTVVNFWATWCGPCRKEQDALEALNKEYASRGVRFVGINIRDSRVNALAYRDEFGVTYPSVENQDSSIAYKFRVLFIPSTFILDKSGGIAARVTGAINERDLRDALDAELAR